MRKVKLCSHCHDFVMTGLKQKECEISQNEMGELETILFTFYQMFLETKH